MTLRSVLQIDMLSKVNHKNFVNLIGYCQEEDPFTRMMVFEYAPNGTLFEHLHSKYPFFPPETSRTMIPAQRLNKFNYLDFGILLLLVFIFLFSVCFHSFNKHKIHPKTNILKSNGAVLFPHLRNGDEKTGPVSGIL